MSLRPPPPKSEPVDPLVELDRRVSVLAAAIDGYEIQRDERSAPTLDMLELLQAHAHHVADGVDEVLEARFGDAREDED